MDPLEQCVPVKDVRCTKVRESLATSLHSRHRIIIRLRNIAVRCTYHVVLRINVTRVLLSSHDVSPDLDKRPIWMYQYMVKHDP